MASAATAPLARLTRPALRRPHPEVIVSEMPALLQGATTGAVASCKPKLAGAVDRDELVSAEIVVEFIEPPANCE
jgi:hypothetical protein